MNKQDVKIKRYFFTDLLTADKYIMGFITDLQSMGDDEWEHTFGKAFHLDEICLEDSSDLLANNGIWLVPKKLPDDVKRTIIQEYFLFTTKEDAVLFANNFCGVPKCVTDSNGNEMYMILRIWDGQTCVLI